MDGDDAMWEEDEDVDVEGNGPRSDEETAADGDVNVDVCVGDVWTEKVNAPLLAGMITTLSTVECGVWDAEVGSDAGACGVPDDDLIGGNSDRCWLLTEEGNEADADVGVELALDSAAAVCCVDCIGVICE